MQNFGIKEALKTLGVNNSNLGTSTGKKWLRTKGKSIVSYSPADGRVIGRVQTTDARAFEKVMQQAQQAFVAWRLVPAPKRGEVVRQIGEALRKNKEALGKLVSYEMGKSYQEGLGEVQEMIDICDFAVGLSRQLYGLQIQSERPEHRMFEQYHP
ncbi:MAG: aldehyde dehydrogenase family protein, partial [Bacteroidota bacterium]